MPLAEQFRALLQRYFPKKRKKRKTEASSSILNFLETSRAISIAIFGITVAAIVITSFVESVLPASTAQLVCNDTHRG